MGAGKFENKHVVGILLNKKWRKRINWTDYINERAIATSITVNKQRVLLMSVYFPHSRYADHHVERACRAIEKHTKSKKSIQFVGGDFNAGLGPGIGVERVSVGTHTLKEGNKRGDWMNQWLMMQNFVAPSTTYRKTPEKQVTHRTPKGVEKRLGYILVDRKHLPCSRDAEANDMIHMGSDHSSVMAQFVITATKKEVSEKVHIEKKKTTTAETIKGQAVGRIRSDEANMFEERNVELDSKIKQEAESAANAQKSNEIEPVANNLGEDANAAAAAATKEKEKKTGDMPRSKNSKKRKDQ